MGLAPLIDSSRCTGCGKCVEICPKDVLFLNNNIAEVNDNECMLCSHCYAVCAFNAVSFEAALKGVDYFSFDYNEKICTSSDFSPQGIINIC